MNKKLSTLRNLFLTGILFSPFVIFAQYAPLAPLPGTTSSGVIPSLSVYLEGLFKLGIGIAAVLAVVMITIAGIEYMGGGANESLKSDAKGRIWSAIIGLLIAISIWLLLNIINPQLLSTSLNIKPVTVASSPGAALAVWCYTPLSGSEICLPGTFSDCDVLRSSGDGVCAIKAGSVTVYNSCYVVSNISNGNIATKCSDSGTTSGDPDLAVSKCEAAQTLIDYTVYNLIKPCSLVGDSAVDTLTGEANIGQLCGGGDGGFCMNGTGGVCPGPATRDFLGAPSCGSGYYCCIP